MQEMNVAIQNSALLLNLQDLRNQSAIVTPKIVKRTTMVMAVLHARVEGTTNPFFLFYSYTYLLIGQELRF